MKICYLIEIKLRYLKSSFLSLIAKNLANLPGWRTDRKIVVFESDDWGSIRMPSKEMYSAFLKKGYDISGSFYNRFDTLESNDDLLMLYDVLTSSMDSQGNPPVITANMVVGNPDFGCMVLLPNTIYITHFRSF